MNPIISTAAIAQQLNIAADAIISVEKWAQVIWVRFVGGCRFVSKKVINMTLNVSDDLFIAAEKEGTIWVAPYKVNGKFRPCYFVRLNYENRKLNVQLGGEFDYNFKSWIVQSKKLGDVKKVLTDAGIMPTVFWHSSVVAQMQSKAA